MSKRSGAAVFAGAMLALAGYLAATAAPADPPAATTSPPTTTAPAPPAPPPAATTTTTAAPPPASTTTAVTTTTTAAPSTTATTTAATTTTARTPKPPPPPRLSVSRAVTAADEVTVGSTLSYTVSLRNTSKTGTGANIVDTLGDSVALVGADADQAGACSSSGTQVTCVWEAVDPNVTATAVIVVQVIRAGTMTNSVEPRAADPTATFDYGPDFAPVNAGQGAAIRFASS